MLNILYYVYLNVFRAEQEAVQFPRLWFLQANTARLPDDLAAGLENQGKVFRICKTTGLVLVEPFYN